MVRFLSDHSSEIVVGVVQGLVTTFTIAVIVWCWQRSLTTVKKREEREKLLEQFGIAMLNFYGNMTRYLDGDPATALVLVNPSTQKVSKDAQQLILKHVGKLQESVLRKLAGHQGLFGFSSRQHDLMSNVFDRLGTLGTAVQYYGTGGPYPVAGKVLGLDDVRAAWADVLAVLGYGDDYRRSPFLLAMRLRYRFLGFACPQLAKAKLPPQTDSKGSKSTGYFGPVDLDEDEGLAGATVS
jgi:hypothetical protein